MLAYKKIQERRDLARLGQVARAALREGQDSMRSLAEGIPEIPLKMSQYQTHIEREVRSKVAELLRDQPNANQDTVAAAAEQAAQSQLSALYKVDAREPMRAKIGGFKYFIGEDAFDTALNHNLEQRIEPQMLALSAAAPFMSKLVNAEVARYRKLAAAERVRVAQTASDKLNNAIENARSTLSDNNEEREKRKRELETEGKTGDALMQDLVYKELMEKIESTEREIKTAQDQKAEKDEKIEQDRASEREQAETEDRARQEAKDHAEAIFHD